MTRRKIDNKGMYIENQNIAGGEVYNAARDIVVNQSKAGISMQEFQSLLGQIGAQLRTADLPKSERQDIEAIVAQVLKQSQKEEPKKSLVIGPLQTAFELIIQAAGATTAAKQLAQLIHNAILLAQNLF